MEEAYHQQGGRYLVQMCHTISMEEVHHQYHSGGPCSIDLSHHQYRGGCGSTWLPILLKG